MVARQGDLLFVRAEIPEAAERTERTIVARGEATGHAHRLVSKDAALLVDETETYLQAVAEATIVHEEHKPVTLPPGDYRVVHQREYEPSGIRQVAD